MLAKVAPDHQARHQRIADRKREIYPDYFDLIHVNEGLVLVLNAMRQFARIALVTSASRQSVTPLLEAKQLGSLFDILVCSDDVANQKPNPEPFRLAAERLKVAPSDCLVFEDSDIGLKAAKTFGAQIWQVHWAPARE